MSFLDDLGGLLQPVADAGKPFRDFVGYGDRYAIPKKAAGAALAVGGASLVIGTGGAILGAAAPATPIIGGASTLGAGILPGIALPSWAIPAGVGAAAGAVLFGGKKGDQITNQNQYTTQNTSTVSANRQITNNTNITGDWSTNSSTITGSPGASIINKKGNIAGTLTGNPAQSNPVTSSPSQSASQSATQSSGMDWTTIAAILGVALVAYGYTSRKAQ